MGRKKKVHAVYDETGSDHFLYGFYNYADARTECGLHIIEEYPHNGIDELKWLNFSENGLEDVTCKKCLESGGKGTIENLGDRDAYDLEGFYWPWG